MNDTDHMPPEGLAQITAEEYAVISHWIAAGAKTDMTVKSADLASELTHAFGSVFATPKPDDGAKPPDAGAKGETPPDDDDDGGHGPEPQGPPPVQGGGCASCTAGHAPDAALWPALAFLAGLTGLFARRLSSTRRRPGA
jgi:MYXO-CTERM domain-containing protein